MLASSPKDNGVRNLFALIQGIREAVNEGHEDAKDYHWDEGDFEDPVIPEREGMEDDTDAYEESEDHVHEDESGKAEEKEVEKPAAPRAFKRKPLRRRRHRGRLMLQGKKPPAQYPPPPGRLESKPSQDDLPSPPAKLPRALTEESYVGGASPLEEQQLEELMAKISAVACSKESEMLASNKLSGFVELEVLHMCVASLFFALSKERNGEGH